MRLPSTPPPSCQLSVFEATAELEKSADVTKVGATDKFGARCNPYYSSGNTCGIFYEFGAESERAEFGTVAEAAQYCRKNLGRQ